jgi:hypothetical protein
VLVRPHPERIKEWTGILLDGLENVAVGGRNPIDADAKADYFDSIYYSRAVVGLCTTVFLEAAIIGRPVLTMQLPAYRMHQDGMVHFRYLLNVEGGLLHTAPDVVSHLSHLAGRHEERWIARGAQPAFSHRVCQARRSRVAINAEVCRDGRGTRTPRRTCAA